MIAGDYTEKTRINSKGKTVTDRVVKSTTGVEYAVSKKPLGAGGVAKVYHARRLSDGKECVFKEYVHSTDPAKQQMHNRIRGNIQNLMAKPLMGKDKVTPLSSFVGPMDKNSLINLPQSHGFGYMMECVDMKRFLPILKLWHADTYPDAAVLCKICANIADLFYALHFAGWNYKDINEDNIFMDTKTGEIRIIDCDNIGTQDRKTIKGTQGYMAPEVYDGGNPDTKTDYYSMAVLLYRLLVGGYPLEGKKTSTYMMKTEQSVSDCEAVIYGKDALFAFDPNNTANSIRLSSSEKKKFAKNAESWAIQVKRWERLSPEIQNGFIQTFSDGLFNPMKRQSDSQWGKIFTDLSQNGLVRCSCGKYNFGDAQNEKECMFCHQKLPKLSGVKKEIPTSVPSITTQAKSAAKSTSVISHAKQVVSKVLPAKPKIVPVIKTAAKSVSAPGELTTVVFRVKRDTEPSHIRVTAKRKQKMPGEEIYEGLQADWMRIVYSKKRNLLAAENLGPYEWTVAGNTVAKGERVILEKDKVITVFPQKLQLKVAEIH